MGLGIVLLKNDPTAPIGGWHLNKYLFLPPNTANPERTLFLATYLDNLATSMEFTGDRPQSYRLVLGPHSWSAMVIFSLGEKVGTFVKSVYNDSMNIVTLSVSY